MIMALTIGVLVTGAVYLMQQRGLVRIVFGMQLMGHAGNLMLLAAGVGAWRGEVFPDRADMADAADPLPQAFVLTAIVISMATATILLTYSALGRSDDTRVKDPFNDDVPQTNLEPIATTGWARQTEEDRKVVAQHQEAQYQAQLAQKED
ncbi:monovalent cation/H+ antiporter subunit C [Corynebacterium renale]|uniref:cation:proton antiporter subunit C n=1 Tax=Corynebacterium renale TaxID=1724 RepID=UPI000DA3EE5E|nr:cation:proton antiporter subunit C [Corynebacterium renale]SQG63838.1 monovalent cation/H+ antiporter subunit C [Corynebacterium renale]STD02371.1 monovalent cation/H+ antiporter subunit C [Corynebacterium renale]